MKIVFARSFLVITQQPQMRTKALNKAKRAYHEMGYLSAEEVDGADEAMDDDDA